MADIHVDDPTDIPGSYDAQLNPLLRDSESKGSDVDYSSSKVDDSSTPTSGVSGGETKLTDSPAWVVNRTPGAGGTPGQPWSKRLLGGLKKSGPATAVVGGLVGLGIGASMLLSPSMLLVHIKEVIVGRFNIQSTSLDTLSNRLLVKKLVSVGTSGCGATQVLQKCKYSKMSNKMLTKLKEAGFTPVDKKGVPIDIKEGWGSERPYGFTNPNVGVFDKKGKLVNTAEGQIITAKMFPQLVRDNPAFAATFRKVFNPSWSAFWDSTFMTKFLGSKGLDKTSKVSGDTEEDVRSNFDDQVDGKEKTGLDVTTKPQDGEDSDAAKAREGNVGEADDLLKKAGTEATNDLTDTITKEVGGKLSGGTMLIANLYCMAQSTGTIAKAVRAIQMTQIIAYGLLFLQAADEIVAGHGSPAKAAFFGTALTTVLIDANTKKVTKKSATDSVGMKYALLKDKGATSTTSDYTKYLPGGGVVSMLKQFSDAISGTGEVRASLEAMCSAINSDAAMIAELALNFSPVGAVMAAVGWIVGQSGILSVVIAPLLGMLAGKIVDSSLQAEDLGNASATGMVQLVAEGANAGSMMPLTTSQANAYFKMNAETQLANARIDQATLSPFDASNPNTFLGSIVTQLIPYYGSMQSVTGIFGSIGKLVTSSFSSIVSPTTLALDDSDIGGCPDTSLSEGDVAVGKLCNMWYGIPVEYLKKVQSGEIDPDENQTYLEQKGMLNEDGTFVAGSEAETYITECSGGDGSAGSDCAIKDEEHARYVIANVYRRLERNMDGEDTVADGSSVEPPSTATPTGTCPTGTTVVQGITKGWQQGSGSETDITLCSIPNTSAQIVGVWTDSKYQGTSSLGLKQIAVNSEAAQPLLDAATQYKKETGKELSASVGYRSVYEQCAILSGNGNHVLKSQSKYYDKYCAPNSSWLKYPGGDWTTGVVISNHLMGISIDFTDASESWMRKCVSDNTDGASDNRCYGFYDDVNQKCLATKGCTFYDKAHFTFKPKTVAGAV